MSCWQPVHTAHSLRAREKSRNAEQIDANGDPQAVTWELIMATQGSSVHLHIQSRECFTILTTHAHLTRDTWSEQLRSETRIRT